MAYLDVTGLTRFWERTKTHCDTRQTDRYDPNNPVLTDNRQFVLVSKKLLSLNDLFTSVWTYTVREQTYNVTPINTLAYKDDGYAYGALSLTNSSGVSKMSTFYIIYNPGTYSNTNFYEAGLYVGESNINPGQPEISIFNNIIDLSWGSLDKLDDKYLSDNVALVDSNGKIPDSKIPNIDWSKVNNPPTSLPANGGNADTVDGKRIVVSSSAPTVNDQSIITFVI